MAIEICYLNGIFIMKRFLLTTFVLLHSELSYSNLISTHQEQSENKQNEEIEYRFDLSTLNSLGYGKEVADFYSTSNRFYPGLQNIRIILNNTKELYLNLDINDAGKLCLDDSLIESLKLNLKENVSDSCHQLNQYFPSAKIKYLPTSNTIEILLPEDAFSIKPNETASSDGGYAFFSNYDVYGMKYSSSHDREIYHGRFESGINFSNWVLRNQSDYSYGYNSHRYEINETTLSRAVKSINSSIQLGQINTYGNLYSGTTITGIQLYSDGSLNDEDRLTIPVTGIAEHDATLEISQNGRVLYRTLVSAGYYEINHVRNVSQGQPLDIKLIDTAGQEKKYSVATANIIQGHNSSSYLLSLGKFRAPSRGGNYDTPFVFNAEYGSGLYLLNYFTGLQVSDSYQSMAGRINKQFESTPFSADAGITLSNNDGQTGAQYDSNIMSSYKSLSLGFSGLYRERNYLNINEATLKKHSKIFLDENTGWYNYDSNNNSRFTGSFMVGYMTSDFGSIGYTLGYTTNYANDKDTISHTVSYGWTVHDVRMNLNYQTRQNDGYTTFLSASIPLGKRSKITTRYQRRDGESDINTVYSQRVGDDFSYSLGASKDIGSSKYNHTTAVNGSFNMTTPYSKLAGSTMRTNRSFSSYMLSASGAVGFADNLIFTSPYELGNTFGVVNVPGQPGVEIMSTGGERTVTNFWGTAVIPRLSTYQKSTVNLSTKRLPLNVRLRTNSFDYNVSHGTILTQKVDSLITKQLLLNVHDENGVLVQSGSSVFDSSGNLVSLITGQGNLLLVNEQIGMPLTLKIANKGECSLSYSIPDEFSSERLYEVSNASCH
ncbi:TPA: fimbrial biogenesis outer membrane usher protein [Klebsiella oxytoca]|nr:fimbrial biogenesis outer membrane usher protein [Klebsiella oxytoca]